MNATDEQMDKTTREYAENVASKLGHLYCVSTYDFELGACLGYLRAIEECNLKQLAEENERLREAIQRALNIAQLWAPSFSVDEIKESEIAEVAALAMMRRDFEIAIKKKP